MKLKCSLLLPNGFFAALQRLGDDPSIEDDKIARYQVMKTKKLLTKEFEAFVKERNDYIETHGKLEGDVLMEQIEKLKANKNLSSDVKAAANMQLESRIAEILVGLGSAETKIIPKDAKDKLEALNKMTDEWKEKEIEIPINSAIKLLAKKSHLSTSELELVDELIVME